MKKEEERKEKDLRGEGATLAPSSAHSELCFFHDPTLVPHHQPKLSRSLIALLSPTPLVQH